MSRSRSASPPLGVRGGLAWAVAGVIVCLLIAAVSALVGRSHRTVGTDPVAAVAVATGPLEPLFRPIAGFTFGDLSSPVVAQMHAAVRAVQADPELRGAFTEVAGRSVLDHGSSVALVVALRVDDRYASRPGFDRSFLSGLTRARGPTTETVILGGRRVVRVADAEGTAALIFYDRGLAVFVGGADDATVLEHVMEGVLRNVGDVTRS
ncbi:MAG: hypothetical protein M3179_15355 [Actinomycetota bacterium]|nr:hypothetical protein [Actinomycetota bacterium]